MCRKVIGVWLLIAFLLGKSAVAQQHAYQVTFTDKNNTPYSLSSPLVYLSARALARRATQGIAVDSTDLPVNPAYVDSVLTLTGGILHETSRWLNMCMILLPDTDTLQILHLNGKPYIRNVKLVGIYGTDLHHRSSQITSTPTSTTGQKTTSSGLSYYGATWNQTQMVNGNFLHDNGYKGQGKLIAVLDAGFVNADTHPGFDSLWMAGRVLDEYDFTFANTNIFLQDVHGEEVLSTMAGYVPGSFVGTAPLASYALYVTEYNPDDQPLELDNLLCGAERADSLGADVITESLGYDLFANPPGAGQSFDSLDGKTTVGAMAANIATKKGMLFVATAGNDGLGYTLNGVDWGTHIVTPGDADSALTIGAVQDNGIIWDQSGYGPNADFVVKPDVVAQGAGTAIFDATGYNSGDGTSFSTPQIAGWAACLWQANPHASPYQIRQAIIKCASQYSAPGPQMGYGIPDFECTSYTLNVKDTPPPFTPSNWVIATPDPFYNEIKLSVSPNASQYVDFVLMDITGKKVVSLHTYMYKSYNTPFAIGTEDLPAGIYILRAVSATQQQVIKLEKQY